MVRPFFCLAIHKKFIDSVDVTIVVGRDVGLMLRAFASALEGENLLVRRGTLDLLVNSLRLNSAAIRRYVAFDLLRGVSHSLMKLFCRSQPSDRTIIMRAAISVVLRRDLSLNRRLYTWLLGPDEKSENQTAYLKSHSLDLLCDILRVRPQVRWFSSLIHILM